MKKMNKWFSPVGSVITLALLLSANNAKAQVRFGDNLGNHTATEALKMQGFDITKSGSMQYNTLAAGVTASAGTIGGTAAASVDVYSSISTSVATAGTNILLASPTVGDIGRIVSVINVGTVPFTLTASNILVNPSTAVSLIWDGSAWVQNGSQSVPLSSLTAATATNTINNANFVQEWDWSTAATESPLTLTANALTTGSGLTLTSSSTGFASSKGLLYVGNTSTATAGTVARVQSNSTAGSGLTVLANGNVGIGIATPKATLQNTGSTIIGGTLAINDVAGGGAIGANTATVDIYTIFKCTQTTTGQTLTLPTPSDATPGHSVTVINEGSASFTLLGNTVIPGASVSAIWDGGQWLINGASGIGKTIVLMSAATNLSSSTASSYLNNSTVNAGSTNSSYAYTFTVPGVLATDMISANFYGNDYTNTTTGWLASSTAANENDGVIIISAVATAANTVVVTLANGVAGSTPSFDSLHLLIGFTH
jgi:hypothetical protein